MDFLRPSASIAHQHTVFSRLETPPTARRLQLGPALNRVSSVLPRGGLVILASDFYCDLDELQSAVRLFRSQRLDLIAIQVLDPIELELAHDNAGRYVDLETGDYLPLNTAAARTGYVKRVQAFQRDLLELFREHGADFVPLRTDATPLPALAAYFARRARLA
jgi:hypothetical protein